MSSPLLTLYRRLSRWPGGRWLFTRAVCFKAPYFASISPRITLLAEGRCEGTLADRRKVRNHIGTAVLFHEGSTLIVVVNALRLLAYKTAERAAAGAVPSAAAA